MIQITESAVEEAALEWIETFGWHVASATPEAEFLPFSNSGSAMRFTRSWE